MFVRKSLAWFLILSLMAPGAALAGGKSGKKNFKEGKKYAALQQWDQAAQEYALAIAAEPDNPEYKLEYFRALQQASMMFVKRGDVLAAQNDFASAYNAYRQAFAYDQSNELARVKMDRMLDLQKAQLGTGESIKYNPHTANVEPVGNEIRTNARPRSKDVQQKIEIRDTGLKSSVTGMARALGLNVIFDETVRDSRFSIDLQDVSFPRALDLVFLQNKLSFELVDQKTIFVYPDNPTNRQKFERLLIKTFYLGNAKHTDVRTAVQGLLGTAGGGRQIASLDQVNALIVRATPSELQMIQEVINSLDKNLAEVVIDVNIYEVSNTAALEIGNQIAVNSQPVTRTERDSTGRPIDVTQGYTPSLTNLGGIAVKGLTNVLGFTYSPFLGGIGTTLGLPPSALSLLQSRGNSKLLYSGQIHALDGQQNQTKVGRSVPVRTGTNYGYGAPQVTTGTPGQQGGTTAGIGGFNSGLFDNIQYKDVGLVIDVTPKVSNEGYVEIKMKLETSDVQQSGESTNLTPTFTQRTLATTSRIQDGVTSVVAGVKINSSGESRAGLAFIGMLPLLGRLFTVPKRSSSEGDIIITVTPHITRAPRINKEDHYAQLSGPMQGGIPRSIEDVVNRIKADEEEERRLIAMQHGLPAATAPVSASATPTIPVSNPAPAPGTPVIQNVGNNPQPFVSDPVRVNTAAPSAPGAIVPAAEQPPSETPPVAEKADEDEPKLTDEEKKALEEINKSLTRPTQPVTQARIVGAEWPENVRRAAEEARAEALKRAKEAKPEQEVTVPPEVIEAHQPKQQVRRASINSGARPAVNATSNEPPPPAAPGQPPAKNDSKKAVAEIPVNLTLAPLSVNPVVGKTFLVNLNASAETAASSARIALNFDPKKLQLKSVRPGAILGSNPDLIHQVSGGELLLTIKSSGQKGGASNGTLAVIEFSVLSSGETIISIDDAGSQITLVGDIPARLSTVASQIKLQQQ